MNKYGIFINDKRRALKNNGKIPKFLITIIAYILAFVISVCFGGIISITPGGIASIVLLLIDGFKIVHFSPFIIILPFLLQFILVFSAIFGSLVCIIIYEEV